MHPSAPRVWLAGNVVADIEKEAARTFPLETGGVLMGYGDVSSAQSVVRANTGPGPRATHRREGFIPDHTFHERETARIYAESGRTWSYLGDWHSHPHGRLALSQADRRTLARIARSTEARAPRPIMLVIAGAPASMAHGHVDRAPIRSGILWESDWPPLVDWRFGAWQLLYRPTALASALGFANPVLSQIELLS
jgi:integrative and conjugative element protein (TIGR02256 family)